MANHNQIGKKGEELAVKFLKEKGYVVLETNWREHKFEIDIVARDRDEIVFVEVKTRTTIFFGTPEEAVSETKQKHLIEGANYYLETKEIDVESRFDVMSIVMTDPPEINHIKEAFSPEWD